MNEEKQNLEETEESEKVAKRNRFERRVHFVLRAICIIILLAIMVSRCSAPKQPKDIMEGVINLPSGFDSQKYVNDKVEEGMFQIFINTNILVSESGQVPLFIQNSEQNKNDTWVELIREDTNQQLYKSDVIKPGFKIEYTTFDLPTSGTYNCLAVFHLLNENGTEINTARAKVVLTVQ